MFIFFWFPFKLYKISSPNFCYFTYLDINECKVYDEEENPKYCGEYPCVNFQGGYRCNYYPYYGLTSLTLRRSLNFLIYYRWYNTKTTYLEYSTNLKVCFFTLLM